MISYFYTEKENFEKNVFNYSVKTLKNMCQKVERHILKNRGSIMHPINFPKSLSTAQLAISKGVSMNNNHLLVRRFIFIGSHPINNDDPLHAQKLSPIKISHLDEKLLLRPTLEKPIKYSYIQLKLATKTNSNNILVCVHLDVIERGKNEIKNYKEVLWIKKNV